MVAGDKRRSAENLEIKSLDYFRDICERTERPRDQCLIALLFLSGRRISEILHLKKKDLLFTDSYLTFKTFNLKSFRNSANKEFNIQRDGRYYPEVEISISRTTEAYSKIGEFIENHVAVLKDQDHIFRSTKGGHIHRKMAYAIIRFADPDVWPHWFRHQRFTNVYNIIKNKVNEPMDVIFVLHDFTKHRRLDTTMNYIHHIKVQELKKEI